jgi:predicted ester cyclase
VGEREAKEVVRRYVAEVLNGGGSGAAERLIADETLRQRVAAFKSAFPDLRVTTHDLVAEGDLVAGRFTGRATHAGVFEGCPATGRVWTAGCTALYRVEGGCITDSWVNWDLLAVMEQLGAVHRAATVSA